ncbi:MAG: hypothetical protein HN444_00425, partial [Euryarchaeota archaeon]|nr:hypothetical protein [Euryarchaeota archaeon]
MSSNQEAHPLPSLGDAHNAPLPEQLVEWVNRLPKDINSILTKIAEADGGVWIVGGAVRDALLGLEDKDIDLAVSLHPEKMLEIFPDALPTGIAYGTLTLRGEEGRFYEATTLRTESEYNDGRRPEVVNFGTSLLGDLERRDFTFNAMAIDARRHLLHDPFNGQGDLEKQR